MSDFSSQQIVEALRSGVPSRTVGAYFSEARPAMMRQVRGKLAALQEAKPVEGMIFTGSYGEGKPIF